MKLATTEQRAVLQHASAILEQLAREERSEYLNHPDLARQIVRARLTGLDREQMDVLYLNSQNALIAAETLFLGTIDQTAVYPREVARRALLHNATNVILAHNHPSGNREPSQADRTITTRIRDALWLFEIRLLDHFVVGDGDPVSMAELGYV